MVNSPPYQPTTVSVSPQTKGNTSSRVGVLTARTLNRDVLPAFCNPIIVMSISVALYITEIVSIVPSSELMSLEDCGYLLLLSSHHRTTATAAALTQH